MTRCVVADDVLYQEVVAGLMADQFHSSWNLVVPPGFGEDEIADRIVRRLAEHPSAPHVARISADSEQARSVNAFAKSLAQQWNLVQELRDFSGDSALNLERILNRLPSSETFVQVLVRYHKIAENLNIHVLSALRTAEQRGRLRSVTIAPAEHSQLKERWRSLGLAIVNSDYGDRHQIRLIGPPSPDELLSAAAGQKIPDSVARLAFELSGGYPEAFRTAISAWVTIGRPASLGPETRRRLREAVETALARFVRWMDLDVKEAHHFRDQVIALHHGLEPAAYERLSRHGWGSILVDSDGLRCDCLAGAALRLVAREGGRGDPSIQTDLAARLYQRRQYSAALEATTDAPGNDPRLLVLRANSAIHVCLWTSDGGEPDIDAPWSRIRREITTARALVERLGTALGKEVRADLELRYGELDSIAETLLSAIASCGEGRQRDRIVDWLAGMISAVRPGGPKAALLLLASQVDAARNIPGAGAACRQVLAIPEQTFRVWAFWHLKVSYYDAPEPSDSAWEAANRSWPEKVHGPLRKPERGKSFGSFNAFAYFAFARALEFASDNGGLPERSFAELEASLSRYEELRNPRSHAVCTTTKPQRDRYFALLDRWLDALFAASPEPCARRELMTVFAPLPIPPSQRDRV